MTTASARPRWAPSGALLAVCLCLTACTPWAAQPVLEKLDTVSGLTVIALAKPAQLTTERNRGPDRDPFAFLAPFETDRMGSRELYLWASVPQDKGSVQHMEILCDDQPLALRRLEGRPTGVSRSPYPLPAPWSSEWYFSLPDGALQCLAGARTVSVVAQLSGEVEDRFHSWPDAVKSLAAFASHHANPLQ